MDDKKIEELISAINLLEDKLGDVELTGINELLANLEGLNSNLSRLNTQLAEISKKLDK